MNNQINATTSVTLVHAGEKILLQHLFNLLYHSKTVLMLFKEVLCLLRLHLFQQKYSKNSCILK